MQTKKFALVLSGGGFKGAFQLGALNWLRKPENWKQFTGLDTLMHFDIVAGVSVGSLNGAMVAMKKYDLLDQLWQEIIQKGAVEIYESAFIDSRGKIKVNFQQLKSTLFSNLPFKIGLLLHLIFNKKKFYQKIGELIEAEFAEYIPKFTSLAANNGLLTKLHSLIKREYIPATTKYLCGFVSIHDGKYYRVASNEFLTDEELCKGLLASTSMPIVWGPVPTVQFVRNGTVTTIKNAMDGGLRNNSPLGDVIDFINEDQEAEYHILVINCSSGKVEVLEKKWNIASIALRSLTDIAMEEIFNNDIEVFLKINDIVTQANEQGVVLKKGNNSGKEIKLKRIHCTIINPDSGTLGDTLSSDPALMQSRMKHGEEKAKLAIQELN